MRVEGNDQRLSAATAIQLQQSGAQQQVIAPKSVQQKEARDNSKSDSVASIGGDKVSIRVELPQNTVDTLQKMGNISDFLNSVATNLRQTNEGLTAAKAVTEQMKASLDKIIKNYPPYPPESKDRMDQLMQFASLRNQIQGMMIPPLPQPIYEKSKHLWEGLTGGNGGTVQTPSLPQYAPDSHVSAASKQLEVISGQIGLAQEAMTRSVTG
jgi:hypothetical protein